MNKTNKKEEAIVDVNYENHFDKDFFGQSINTDKQNDETFFDNLEQKIDSIGNSINETINVISEAYQQYQKKQKINFTILDTQDINALTKNQKEYANQLAASIGSIIASIGVIFLLFISPVYVLISIIMLIASITIIVTSSIKFHSKTKLLSGKSIQLEIKNYDAIKDMEIKHNKKLYKVIRFLLLSVFVPIVILVSVAIFTPMSYLDYIMPLWLAFFFISIGLGVFNVVRYGIIKNYYSKIVKGNRF